MSEIRNSPRGALRLHVEVEVPDKRIYTAAAVRTSSTQRSIKLGKFNGITVKKETIALYGALLQSIFWALVAVFAWFVFWQLIVYRIILYVIYGRATTDSNS